MVDVQLIGVPYNSAGQLGGEAAGPLALRDAGLVAWLQAGVPVHDAGDVAFAAPNPTRSPRSGLIAEGALASMVGAVHGAVGAAYAAARFPLLIGGECPLVLGALAAEASGFGTQTGGGTRQPAVTRADGPYAACSTAHTAPHRSVKSRRWSARETVSFRRWRERRWSRSSSWAAQKRAAEATEPKPRMG